MMKLNTRSAETRHCPTMFGDEGMRRLGAILREQSRRGGKTILLADENTHVHCLPLLPDFVPGWQEVPAIVIRPGEESKTLDTASVIWRELAALGADRHALLLNLGGGVVTDIGGFAAACFKRGIRFIHIPTTLMGMADAATGGKTGIDVGPVKNLVGTFTLPDAVVIHPAFLGTLPELHLRSGLAEVAKSALVGDRKLWNRLLAGNPADQLKTPASDPAWMHIIGAAVAVKHRIVRADFREKDQRSLLNFGHTFGHAFESLMLSKGTPISHGEAVAMGMVCESWLSVPVCGLDEEDLREITRYLDALFPRRKLGSADIEETLDLMTHDKKRLHGTTRFALLGEPGRGITRREVPAELVRAALGYYTADGNLP